MSNLNCTADGVHLREGLVVYTKPFVTYEGDRPYLYRLTVQAADGVVPDEDGFPRLVRGGHFALRPLAEDPTFRYIKFRSGIRLDQLWADPLRALAVEAKNHYAQAQHHLAEAARLMKLQPADLEIKDI